MADNQTNTNKPEEDLSSDIASQLTGETYNTENDKNDSAEDTLADGIASQISGQFYSSDDGK